MREHNWTRRGLLMAAGATGVGVLAGHAPVAAADGEVEIPPLGEDQKFCLDQFLPEERQLEALKLAWKEDRKNDVQQLLSNTGEMRAAGEIALGLDPQRAAIFYAKKWAQNR